MKRIFVIAQLIVFTTTLTWAQDFWGSQHVGLAGAAYDIVSAGSTLIASTGRNGIWRSTNSGTTWTQVNTNGELGFNDLEVDGSGNIFATTLSPSTARLYKSTDNGVTFTNVNSTGTAGYFTYFKALPNGNYVGISNSVIQTSSDGGASFTMVNTLAGLIYDAEVDGSNNIIVGVENGGIKISQNGGTTFNSVTGPSTTVFDVSISGSKIVVLAGEGPFLSTDGGATWNSIKGNLPGNSFEGLLKFGPSGKLVLLNSVTSTYYSSTDDGATWSAGTSVPSDISYFAIVFPSAGLWIASATKGLFKSIDSGLTWTLNNKLFAFSDIHVTQSGVLFMAGTGTKGLARTDIYNSAPSLKATDRLVTAFESIGNKYFAYSPNQAGVITSGDGNTWALANASQVLLNLVTTSGRLFSISGTSLLTSTDLAVTWSSAAIAGYGGGATKVIASATPDILFILTNAGVVFKVDVTNAASPTATQLSPTGVIDMAVGGSALYMLTSTTTLQKSLDNGATFSSKTLPGTFAANRVWAFDADIIITRSANSGVYAVNISTNSGGFWKQEQLLDKYSGVSVVDVAFSSSGFAYLAVTNSNEHYSLHSIAPPAAPTNLKTIQNLANTPTAVKPNSASMEFILEDNSNNEEYFVLERSTDNVTWDSVSAAVAGGVLRQRITDNAQTIVQGTQYFYRAKAVNSTASSAYTNVVTEVVNTYCATSIPDNRSWSATATADPGSTANGAGPFTSTEVLIQKDVNTLHSYTAYDFALGIVPPAVLPDFGPELITFFEGCGVVNTGTSEIQRHMGNGVSTWDANTNTLTLKWVTTPQYPKFEGTTVFTLNAEDPTPLAPTLRAYVYSSTEAFLTWRYITYAEEYVIERSLVSGDPNSFQPIATVSYPLTSYIDKNLSIGTYYYQIKARHNNGPGGSVVSSPYSPEAAVQLGATLFRPIETDLNKNLDNQQGSSWADLDNDGDEDLVLCTFQNTLGQNVPPSFFENLGSAQLKRKDLEVIAKDGDAISRGAAVFDFNNDGKLDLYFDRGGDDNDFILINKGSWNFEKLLVHEHVTGSAIENPAVADIDKDSFVDIFVGVSSGGSLPPTSANYLIKNNGGNSVTQVTTGDIFAELTDSRSVSFADYDNDGDQDLLLLNWQNPLAVSALPQRLYQNDGNGNFSMVTGTIFDTDLIAQARTSSWGDIDNDGDLDLFIGSQSNVTSPSNPNYSMGYDRLYRNDNGTFVSLVSSEVAMYSTGTFGSTFGDIDNDGDLDLLVSNQAGTEDFRGESVIFTNDGAGNFTKVISDELFTNKYVVTAGISLADVDKDGFLDVFPVKGSSFGTGWPGDDIPNLLYKSTLTPSASRNWIQIKLVGKSSNKAALGARVKVTTSLAPPVDQQIREVAGLTGYGSQNSLIQHFGLKTATTCAITVQWPSGVIQTLTGVAANQFITITEDAEGPVIADVNPTAGQTGVSFTTPLEITFDETPVSVAGKNIKLYVASNLATPVQTFNASVAVITGKKATFTPSAQLLPNTTYKVVIEDGAFKDVYNNAGAYATFDWQFTSLDVTPPVFGSPAVDYPAIVGKGFVSSPFSAAVSDNVSVSSVTMKYRKAGTSDAYTDLAGSFNSGTSEWDFLVLESFYNSTGLEFYLEAKDADQNTTLYPAAGTLQSLFETTPPTLTIGMYPTLVYKGYGSMAFQATATDNYSIASVVMSYRNTKDGVAFVNVPGTLDGTVPNQYNFSVPESGMNGVGIEFYFTATDPSGNSTRNPTSPDLVQLLFETTPPQLIVPTNPITINKGFGSLPFKVTATDNVAVTSVVLNYRNTKDGVTFLTINGSPDGTVANQYNFTLPESALKNAGVEYFFTAFDATGNSTRNPASPDVFELLLESTPPVVTVPTNPELIAKGFGSRAFQVTATDNFGVANVQINYRNTKDGVNYTALSGTADGTVVNQYNFSVPEAAFNGNGLEYYFTATDATGNTVRSPLATDNPSTYKMMLDNQAPSIANFAAPASLIKANTVFTVKASDNIAVSSIVMKYRGIAAKDFTTSVAGTKNTNGDYDFNVAASWFDDMGIEYYFRAVDESKNVAVYPDTTASTNKYLKTFIKFEGESLPKLDLIKGSTGASGYQIVSVPLELSNKNIADNFEELGTADKTAYRFLRYHETPTPGWDEYPGGGLSILNRGEGYFLNSLKAEQITLLAGAAPALDQEHLFELSLKKGWNQIGNPYTVQIQWKDVIAYNKNPAGVGVTLTKYDNGYNTNDPDGIIEPYKGGFVKAESDITLKIPFKGLTTGGRTERWNSNLQEENWRVPFTLTQADQMYQMGLIGMQRDALEGMDNYDLPAVPRWADFVEATFPHPEHDMKHFSQDIVPTQDYHEWNVDVNTSLSGGATLAWDHTMLGENDKDLYLVDMGNQQVIDMRMQGTYSFDPRTSSKFRIYFGTDLRLKVKPMRVSLSKVYPNPSVGETTIAFAIPENRTASDVAVEIFDMMGRKVTTLVSGKLVAGFYTTTWNAEAPQYTAGVYICRLLVSEGERQEVRSEKIVLTK